MTHIHPDHVGWNLSDGSPTFPNARYLVTRTDWDHWTQPEVREQAPHVDEQMIPLEGLNVLDLIEGEYSVTDELTTLPTPGHTPGHISIVVSSGGESAFILGDVAHSPAQAQYTDWSPVFDVDPDLARQTQTLGSGQAGGRGDAGGVRTFPGYGLRAVRSGRRAANMAAGVGRNGARQAE